MTILVSPSQADVLVVLRTFLLSVLPTSVEVVRGQVNRVAEPASSDFVVMTPIRRQRLETNDDENDDVKFVGSISGNVLTVTAIDSGALRVGSTIFGTGVTDGTVVDSFGAGTTGGAGTYVLNNSQTVASEVMSAGQTLSTQNTELTVQLDVHGPSSAENAQIISTLIRDDYGYSYFDSSGVDAHPLHADDPRQIPFINDQEQYEDRWVVECCLQVNETVQIPQEYADSVVVGLVDVDVVYPP